MSFALKIFEKQCLNAHNKSRSLYNSPPLKLSSQLSKHATQWAESLARRNAVYYRPNNIYGENIYYLKHENRVITGDEPVQRWFGDVTEIYESAQRKREPNNNLLQLIWDQTKELGIGVAQREGKVWIVTNYYPKCTIYDVQQELAPKFQNFRHRKTGQLNRFIRHKAENEVEQQKNFKGNASDLTKKMPKKSVSFSV